METLSPNQQHWQPRATDFHALWMSDIILHIRDDLFQSQQWDNATFPSRQEIDCWVSDSYYKTITELEWQQAVLSLLLRIRAKNPLANSWKRQFIDLAILHIEKTLLCQ